MTSGLNQKTLCFTCYGDESQHHHLSHVNIQEFFSYFHVNSSAPGILFPQPYQCEKGGSNLFTNNKLFITYINTHKFFPPKTLYLISESLIL